MAPPRRLLAAPNPFPDAAANLRAAPAVAGARRNGAAAGEKGRPQMPRSFRPQSARGQGAAGSRSMSGRRCCRMPPCARAAPAFPAPPKNHSRSRDSYGRAAFLPPVAAQAGSRLAAGPRPACGRSRRVNERHLGRACVKVPHVGHALARGGSLPDDAQRILAVRDNLTAGNRNPLAAVLFEFLGRHRLETPEVIKHTVFLHATETQDLLY